MTTIIKREYSESEITECRKFYRDIVQTHDTCLGVGFVFNNNDQVSEVQDCSCDAVFRYIRDLIYIRLPRRYWFVDMNSYQHSFDDHKDLNFFEKYLECLYLECKGDHSFLLYGLPNGGKTSLLAIIAKWALSQDIKVFYVTPEDLLAFAKKEGNYSLFYERLCNAEIVLVDDLMSYNKAAWTNLQIELILRQLFDAGINLIIALSEELQSVQKSNEGLFIFLQKIEQDLIVNYKGTVRIETNKFLGGVLEQEAIKFYQDNLVINNKKEK